MSAELEAHGREHPISEFFFASRHEALIQSRAEDGGRRALIDGGGDRPAALAGIGHTPRKRRQLWIFNQRRGGQIEQPRSDHAAAPPDFRDVGEVEVISVMFWV